MFFLKNGNAISGWRNGRSKSKRSMTSGTNNIQTGIVNLFEPYPVWQSCGMNTLVTATTYKNHRFPIEIISHAVWLYFRFCLSFRDVEELLFARGVVVTYEAIRKWC